MSTATPERTNHMGFNEHPKILTTHDRQFVEDRIVEILTMPEEEVTYRLMALVGLTNVVEDVPPLLVTSIEQTAGDVIDKTKDEDYRIGEVAALIDAAHITGNTALAETALKVVREDIEFEKFPFDTHAAASISVEEGVGYRDAVVMAQELREKTDLPLTAREAKKYGYLSLEPVPLGAEYDWLFDPNMQPAVRD